MMTWCAEEITEPTMPRKLQTEKHYSSATNLHEHLKNNILCLFRCVFVCLEFIVKRWISRNWLLFWEREECFCLGKTFIMGAEGSKKEHLCASLHKHSHPLNKQYKHVAGEASKVKKKTKKKKTCETKYVHRLFVVWSQSEKQTNNILHTLCNSKN